jgi:hypothetical protein
LVRLRRLGTGAISAGSDVGSASANATAGTKAGGTTARARGNAAIHAKISSERQTSLAPMSNGHGNVPAFDID